MAPLECGSYDLLERKVRGFFCGRCRGEREGKVKVIFWLLFSQMQKRHILE
jgi:hypothetical protein